MFARSPRTSSLGPRPRSSPLYTLLAEGDLPPEAPKLSNGISRALLPLEDAYAARPPPWGPPLRSSYRNGRILDYIWTSSAVTVLRTMPVCNAAGSAHPHRIPSLDHPSDHMPIGASPQGHPWRGTPPSPLFGGAGKANLLTAPLLDRRAACSLNMWTLTVGLMHACPPGALLSWSGAPLEESGLRPAWQQLYVENVIRGDESYKSG